MKHLLLIPTFVGVVSLSPYLFMSHKHQNMLISLNYANMDKIITLDDFGTWLKMCEYSSRSLPRGCL